MGLFYYLFVLRDIHPTAVNYSSYTIQYTKQDNTFIISKNCISHPKLKRQHNVRPETKTTIKWADLQLSLIHI